MSVRSRELCNRLECPEGRRELTGRAVDVDVRYLSSAAESRPADNGPVPIAKPHQDVRWRTELVSGLASIACPLADSITPRSRPDKLDVDRTILSQSSGLAYRTVSECGEK